MPLQMSSFTELVFWRLYFLIAAILFLYIYSQKTRTEVCCFNRHVSLLILHTGNRNLCCLDNGSTCTWTNLTEEISKWQKTKQNTKFHISHIHFDNICIYGDVQLYKLSQNQILFKLQNASFIWYTTCNLS